MKRIISKNDQSMGSYFKTPKEIEYPNPAGFCDLLSTDPLFVDRNKMLGGFETQKYQN